jgi:hypothetical protein
LRYSHEVHFGSEPRDGRLSIDPITISPSDLVLEKIQIHQINEKDIKDLVTLFALCEISDQEGRGNISRRHIGLVLAEDWGFWYTVTINLGKIKSYAEKYREQFKYVVVDEFQDTNWAQYELLKMLVPRDGNIVVVGDDDQSIYKFLMQLDAWLEIQGFQA